MIEVEKGDIINSLYGEKEFYTLVNKPIGIMYTNFIRSYIKRDRGFKEALTLLEYLFLDENNVFFQLEQITDALQKYIPAMNEEKIVIEKLKKDIGFEIQKIYEKSLEKKMFYPEDFANMASYLASMRTYLDYRMGINLVRLSDLKGIYYETLNKYEPYVRNFLYKKKNNIDYYMGSVEGYGFLVFFIIDSHDDSLLEKRRSKNYKFTISYTPIKGINEILFSKLKTVQVNFRNRVRDREINKLCLPEYLAIVSDFKKIEEYYKKIYGKEIDRYLYI
ncbi:MAG: hypothetical protein QXW01_03395 [Candidatus Aenigmatarchaeota archaeon]